MSLGQARGARRNSSSRGGREPEVIHLALSFCISFLSVNILYIYGIRENLLFS
jgi:hypothetical protein